MLAIKVFSAVSVKICQASCRHDWFSIIKSIMKFEGHPTIIG